jgi:hypothetical protein
MSRGTIGGEFDRPVARIDDVGDEISALVDVIGFGRIQANAIPALDA